MERENARDIQFTGYVVDGYLRANRNTNSPIGLKKLAQTEGNNYFV